MERNYLRLGNLEVYKLSIVLSRKAWCVYNRLHWSDKKIMGNQFVRSVDSIGANISEGYGRYHYLDKVKFYYNARGSLLEAKHWVFLLMDRKKVSKQEFNDFIKDLNTLHHQLNIFIKNTKKNK